MGQILCCTKTTNKMTTIQIASALLFMAVSAVATAQNAASLAVPINENAPVKARRQLYIEAAPTQVWQVLTAVNNWPAWNAKITKAALPEAAHVGTAFKWTVNGAKINSIFHTVKPGVALGWTGSTFGGTAIHNWRLEATGSGTTVFVEESMQGWLISLFKGKMNHDLDSDMQIWLESLKAECEKQGMAKLHNNK